MLKQERWSNIMKLCKQHTEVTVDQLVAELDASPATVRRDLQKMEDLNMISRFHGGARINQIQYSEPSMIIKKVTNKKEKSAIALTAARQIKDNQMVFIDAGSSTFEMIQYINAKNITVVTNGIPHISLLINKEITTIVLGGALRASTEATTGRIAVEQLQDMYFDMAFVGTNGIHNKIGFSTSNEQEALLKKTAIEQSETTFILADHSKFNVICPEPFASLNDAIIITDDISDFKTNGIKYMCTNGKNNCYRD